MKVRVVCEILFMEGYELLLVELFFNWFFNEFILEVMVVIFSVFIFDEKVEMDVLKEELVKLFREVQVQVKIIVKVSVESKLDVNEEEYVNSLKWQLMEMVMVWVNGRLFVEIRYVFLCVFLGERCFINSGV